ncbi:MAG: hypothetical protein FWF09_05820, partial [Bacteroidales bacterium]|nr:hypothetical protein [Bacteroidales bacterium]
MIKSIFLRNVTAIAICLAATTSAQAQIGGAIKNAANAAKKEVQQSANQAVQNTSTSVTDAVNNTATQATETVSQPATSSGSASQASQPEAQPAPVQPAAVQQTAAASAPAQQTDPPSTHPQKEANYKRCFDLLEKAKAATDYDGILNPYAGVMNGRKGFLQDKIFSCGDPEIAKLDAEMIALEKKLWEMYNELKAAGKTPKYEPFEFVGCQQVLTDRAAWEQANAAGLGFPVANDVKPMPQTVTVAADVIKKIEELSPKKPFIARVEKAGGKVVRYVYTSNQWREGTYKDEVWPHPELK